MFNALNNPKPCKANADLDSIVWGIDLQHHEILYTYTVYVKTNVNTLLKSEQPTSPRLFV